MESLDRIEEKIRLSQSIKPESKGEFAQLVAEVRSEIAALSQDDQDQAESIAGFVRSSTHEATRATSDPQLMDLAVQGLQTSVEGFEGSHPKLVELVNGFCKMLAGLGI